MFRNFPPVLPVKGFNLNGACRLERHLGGARGDFDGAFLGGWFVGWLMGVGLIGVGLGYLHLAMFCVLLIQ